VGRGCPLSTGVALWEGVVSSPLTVLKRGAQNYGSGKCRTGQFYRTGKYRSDNVWKAVRTENSR